MSRAERKSTDRSRTLLAASLAGLVAAAAVAGCSAGQNTQTDSVLPSVNGAHGEVGPIAIRNAVFAYPQGGQYPPGGSAPLVLTIVNTGTSADELVEVTSPVSATIQIGGDRSLLPDRAIEVGTPDQEAVPSPTRTTTTTTTTTTTSAAVSSGSAPPSASSSASSSAPSSVSVTASAEPVEIGKATIVLSGLSSSLDPGKTYRVTFAFRSAGTISLDLPIAAPTTARPEASAHG